MKEIKHHRADFINKHGFHEDASIFSTIVFEDFREAMDWSSSLKIRDCDRTVSLSCWIHNQEDLDNLLFKVNTMVEHLTEYRDAVEKYGKEYLERSKQLEKAKDERDSNKT